MSFLAHMCLKCNHPDFHHSTNPRGNEGGCSYGHCFCTGDFDPEPTLVETWSYPERKPEELIEPGQQWNPGTPHRLVTCKCDACKAKYQELVA